MNLSSVEPGLCTAVRLVQLSDLEAALVVAYRTCESPAAQAHKAGGQACSYHTSFDDSLVPAAVGRRLGAAVAALQAVFPSTLQHLLTQMDPATRVADPEVVEEEPPASPCSHRPPEQHAAQAGSGAHHQPLGQHAALAGSGPAHQRNSERPDPASAQHLPAAAARQGSGSGSSRSSGSSASAQHGANVQQGRVMQPTRGQHDNSSEAAGPSSNGLQDGVVQPTWQQDGVVQPTWQQHDSSSGAAAAARAAALLSAPAAQAQAQVGRHSAAATAGQHSAAATAGRHSAAATAGQHSAAATAGQHSTAATAGQYSAASTAGQRALARGPLTSLLMNRSPGPRPAPLDAAPIATLHAEPQPAAAHSLQAEADAATGAAQAVQQKHPQSPRARRLTLAPDMQRAFSVNAAGGQSQASGRNTLLSSSLSMDTGVGSRFQGTVCNILTCCCCWAFFRGGRGV